MITLNASGGSVTFTFSGNSTYLNDGTITVPVNSLALIIDESDMATFRKAASNDIFVSANIAEFGMTKAELESWYKANMVGSTGGGGDITSGEVQTMIDESISGKADSSDVYTTGQTSGATEIANALNAKLDTTAYTPVQVSTAITENDTNPVAGGAVYDKVHVTSGESSETVLIFEEITVGGHKETLSTNYPSGATIVKLDINNIPSYAGYLEWFGADGSVLGGAKITQDGGNFGVNFNHPDLKAMSGTSSYADNVLTVEVTGFQNASLNDIAYFFRDLASTYNSIKAVKTAKEYWIKDYVDAKVAEAGGGECTVEETVVYNRYTSPYYDYDGGNKVTYAVLDYLGDKSTTYDTQFFFNVGDSSTEYESWMTFDYVNHSANTESLSDYVTVEYVSDIQDFKVSIATDYQSDWWIRQIAGLDSDKNALVPFYTINSGSPCTVIATDVVGLVEKVKDKAYEALSECNLQSSEDIMYLDANHINGSSTRNTIKLEELDGSSSTLKPNIQVGLGVSEWTEMTFNGSCNTNGNPKTPIIRLSGDTNSLDTFNTQWLINLEHYGNTNDSVIWSGSEFVFNSNWFGGNGEFGTASVTYDSASNILTIAYPLTAQVGDYTDNVEMSDIYNQNCQFGTAITKLEYYAEQTQPLKPYVQETRAALGGLSLVKLTQAQYDALATKDDNTLYVVIPNP